jgi:hypothetical protein
VHAGRLPADEQLRADLTIAPAGRHRRSTNSSRSVSPYGAASRSGSTGDGEVSSGMRARSASAPIAARSRQRGGARRRTERSGRWAPCHHHRRRAWPANRGGPKTHLHPGPTELESTLRQAREPERSQPVARKVRTPPYTIRRVTGPNRV